MRDRWLWVLVGLLVLALPLLLHQGREQSFYLDEFDFIVERRLREPSTLFAPWYGHWVTLPAVAYRSLLAVVGLRTYLPYQLLAIAGHFAVVLATWAAARRLGARGWVATVTVLPLVVLGSGRPNILFGFQITLTAALALGMLQLLLATHPGRWSRRDTAGLVCGLVALTCSGVAVATAVGVGAATLLLRGWRMAAAHTAPLAAAYGAWWLLAPDGHSDPDPTISADVLRFAADMARNAFEGIGGAAWAALAIGWLVVVGIATTVQDVRADRARLDRAAVLLGLCATVATFAVSSGVTRAVMHGPEGALEARYVHVLAALALPVVAVGVERFARSSPWWTVPAFAALAVGVPGNVRALAEDVPPNSIAAYARSEHLASADGARELHPLVPIPISLLQDAARNPSEWAAVDVTPAEQLLADLFLTLDQQERPAVADACTVLAATDVQTSAGEPIDFVGDIEVVATDGPVTTGRVPYLGRDGGRLLPSSSLDITIEARTPGSGVLDC